MVKRENGDKVVTTNVIKYKALMLYTKYVPYRTTSGCVRQWRTLSIPSSYTLFFLLPLLLALVFCVRILFTEKYEKEHTRTHSMWMVNVENVSISVSVSVCVCMYWWYTWAQAKAMLGYIIARTHISLSILLYKA